MPSNARCCKEAEYKTYLKGRHMECRAANSGRVQSRQMQILIVLWPSAYSASQPHPAVAIISMLAQHREVLTISPWCVVHWTGPDTDYLFRDAADRSDAACHASCHSSFLRKHDRIIKLLTANWGFVSVNARSKSRAAASPLLIKLVTGVSCSLAWSHTGHLMGQLSWSSIEANSRKVNTRFLRWELEIHQTQDREWNIRSWYK